VFSSLCLEWRKWKKWRDSFKWMRHNRCGKMAEEEGSIQPRIRQKTWGQFVVMVNQEFGILPDVGSRSVNDVLEDVVDAIEGGNGNEG